MKPTALLSISGQSIWLDNISRRLLTSGTLEKYISEFSVVGLTSNPTIFEKSIAGSRDYDDQIRELASKGLDEESIFFELAIADLQQAADLFKPTHERTGGVDGWVSLEVSPNLANDTQGTIEQALELHAKAKRPNLHIKVPGTPEGLPAIEELTARGISVNVTLLFSSDQYLDAAEAYLRGLERRHREGKSLRVESVASVFISRWDRKTADRLPPSLKNRLGVAIGMECYRAYADRYATDRFLRLQNAGARPQRLLFASTSTKDPRLANTFYVTELSAGRTVNTMPEETLLAFQDHGRVEDMLRHDGGDAHRILGDCEKAGVSIKATAEQLQLEGRDAFKRSWDDLLEQIRSKSSALVH
ncbi:MAG: transaldolase [Phycisphaeraceae bacterium]|nr:transaldolase [Phycisphaeraceae bacterium]